MKIPESHILVIFGASGDLTERKLIPAMYDLYHQKLLPENFAVVGVGRTKLENKSFRDKMKAGIQNFANIKENVNGGLDDFLKFLNYISINTSETEDYGALKSYLTQLDKEMKTKGNYIFYLATPPSLYGPVSEYLGHYGLNKQVDGENWRRIVIEKPFGSSLETALSLNSRIQAIFQENQIYRIDHYLGKETVQNLLVTRFSNGIFEPLWNNRYVEYVEISSSESLGIGSRGGYYDQSGALRDMLQNHLMQLVGLTAMEPPALLDSNSIRNETVKVLQSLRPLSEADVRKNVIRGQYTSSMIKGEMVNGYQQEKGVASGSRTETFVAMQFFIDNWRWGGVPFYVRSGKRLPTRVSEIVINFKSTPHQLFKSIQDRENHHNQLIIRIQPDEGILLKFGMKVPGAGFSAQTVNMDFHYSDLAETYLPSSYERLLLDCMLGDSTLYARADAVEASWRFVQPIIDAWANDPKIALHGYPAGTWGPLVADDLIIEDHKW
ncbi:MAG: glucose-6-phosphate dehydrogenase, partial [Bacteroidales bacterium]|nr:glucose-6-phosphate dehydrogenase [Bacteroidales bacterium]